MKSGGITAKRRQRAANQRVTRSAGSAQAAPRSGPGEDPEGGADVDYDDGDHSDADAEDWQSGVVCGRPWPDASRARRPLSSSFCAGVFYLLLSSFPTLRTHLYHHGQIADYCEGFARPQLHLAP